MRKKEICKPHEASSTKKKVNYSKDKTEQEKHKAVTKL